MKLSKTGQQYLRKFRLSCRIEDKLAWSRKQTEILEEQYYDCEGELDRLWSQLQNSPNEMKEIERRTDKEGLT